MNLSEGRENLLPSTIFSGFLLLYYIAQRGQFENTLCGEFSEIMANISIETRNLVTNCTFPQSLFFLFSFRPWHQIFGLKLSPFERIEYL